MNTSDTSGSETLAEIQSITKSPTSPPPEPEDSKDIAERLTDLESQIRASKKEIDETKSIVYVATVGGLIIVTLTVFGLFIDVMLSRAKTDTALRTVYFPIQSSTSPVTCNFNSCKE